MNGVEISYLCIAIIFCFQCYFAVIILPLSRMDGHLLYALVCPPGTSANSFGGCNPYLKNLC